MNDDESFSHLNEEAGSSEEADRLRPVIQTLWAWKAPVPTALETARLAEVLRQAMQARRRNSLFNRIRLGWAVICSQLHVVQAEIWAASFIVFSLGTLVTFGYSLSNATNVTVPFVLIAPIAAAAGIAFLYGPSVDPALEIELALPVSPRQVLVARLALVFGFDLVLGLLGSAALSVLRVDVSFWPLVSAWLSPMAFLASLAFLLITLTLDSGVSILVCLGLWTLENLSRLFPTIHLLFSVPDLTAVAARPWMWLLAVLLSAAALWLGGGEEHWVRKLA